MAELFDPDMVAGNRSGRYGQSALVAAGDRSVRADTDCLGLNSGHGQG